MLAPPALHGGFPLRFAWLLLGLFLCACGIVLFLESELGLPPWDVLHQGLAEQLGVPFGAANIGVSVAVLLAAWALRARIGIGTVANAALIGTFVLALGEVGWVTELSQEPLAARFALLPLALACFGAGSAFYICASMGAGPRDSLMVVAWQRLGIRVSLARAGIEVGALAIGFALGGTVGFGTVVFAVGIGPAVEVSFVLLGRSPLATTPVASGA